jgi:hypothetical protein
MPTSFVVHHPSGSIGVPKNTINNVSLENATFVHSEAMLDMPFRMWAQDPTPTLVD